MQIQYLRQVFSRKMSIEVSETQTTKFATTVHVVIRQDGRDCVVGYVK